MAELEEQLASVLNDPNMMAQIMNMAQKLNLTSPAPEPPTPKQEEAFPPIDMNMIKKLTNFAQQGSIDGNQRTLLKALGPYLSRTRLEKLEKAMRAAKVAKMTTGLLSASQLQSGR